MSNNTMKNVVQGMPQKMHFNADTDSEQFAGDFQTLQLQSKKLLTQCSKIQSMMQSNCQNRAEAQHNLIQYGRRLTQDSTDQALATTGTAELLKMRQQIAELEDEHVHLHQEFITLQSLIRHVVRFQRRRLEETVRNTRSAGTDRKRNPNSTNLLARELTNCTSLFLSNIKASNQKECA